MSNFKELGVMRDCSRNAVMNVAAVKKFYREDVSKEEIVQLGNLGFIRAVEKYNPNVGSSISTYAYYWIRQSVNRGLASIVSHLDVSFSLYNAATSPSKNSISYNCFQKFV